MIRAAAVQGMTSYHWPGILLNTGPGKMSGLSIGAVEKTSPDPIQGMVHGA